MKLPQALTVVLVAAKVFGKSDISWFKAFTPIYVAATLHALAPIFVALEAKLDEAQDNLDDSSS